ncbi:MAG TPA: hypothetical protein VM075_02660 [Anaerolineae bacterium]|nr:hypothetical protein [Anaerolineae bacterium]
METISAHGSLATLLEGGANPSLRYDRNEALLVYLAQRIEEVIAEDLFRARAVDVVHTLITDLDYRLVADYLRARRAGDAAVVGAFERLVASDDITERNKLLYELARARFSRFAASGVDGDIVSVPHPEEVFSRSERGLIIYLRDRALQSPLVALLDDIGARLGYFIEQQYDLPGFNALVRQGVVKKWCLPDGTTIVSKRDNPHKPGRFRTEQLNYEAVLSRMAGHSQDRLLLGRAAAGGGVWLAVVRPFAVIRDGYSDRCYALSVGIDGTTLEALLLNERDPAMRRAHLAHYRWLLDALYDRGILWGDMSPRNTLVQRAGQDFIYHILDFEKTRVLDGWATTAERIAHCRGQVCVEELGVVCTPTEVEECMGDYFAPAAWDLESEAPLPFAPRPEVADVLRGRGLHDVTLGTYNRTDLEIMSVRTPDIDPLSGRRRFPAHMNRKLEHYLSCADYDDATEYDRKTTEILIAAKHHDCFDSILNVLTRATNRVENAFIKAEFEAILDGSSTCYVIPPRHAVGALVHTVDVLYQSRERAEDLQSVCSHLGSERSTGPD